MLVGRTFVAIDGEALEDLAALEVEFLAERFHDELLEVAGEEQEAVLVREHDHGLGAAAFGEVMPGQGERGGRVLLRIRHAGQRVHPAGAVEQSVDINAL